MKNKLFIFPFIMMGIVLVTIGGCKKDTADNSKKDPIIRIPITYGSMTDQEGNTYKTLTIGKQTWMTENLRTTKYNDGTVIPNVTDATAWSSLITGALCTYKNTTNTDTINTYGRLYNWYAVNSGKLCPVGWHVPSDSEWTELVDSLIANKFNYDSITTGNKVGKSMASTSGWSTYNKIGCVGNNQSLNNRSGFTGLPAGARAGGANFGDFGVVNYLWSSTDINADWAICRYLVYDNSSLGTFDSYKVNGFSIRCIKN